MCEVTLNTWQGAGWTPALGLTSEGCPPSPWASWPGRPEQYLKDTVEGRPKAAVALQGAVGLDLVVAQAAAPVDRKGAA